MITTVYSRSGAMREFDPTRITAAILKASHAAQESLKTSFAEEIANNIHSLDRDDITVEEVQDLVEHYLMKSHYEKTAKAYIAYRRKKNEERQEKQKRLQIFNELVEIKDSDIKNDNANMNGNTPAGQMMKFASLTSIDYTTLNLLKPEFAEAHKTGIFYIHDLDYYSSKSTTCSMYDLTKMLKDGFNPGHGYLRAPNSIRAAAALTAIIFQINQNEQHRFNCASM